MEQQQSHAARQPVVLSGSAPGKFLLPPISHVAEGRHGGIVHIAPSVPSIRTSTSGAHPHQKPTADDLYAEGLALMDQGRAPQEKILQGLQKVTQAGMDGSKAAQSTLALFYFAGSLGLPRDETLAVQWWERAAAQGDDMAHYNLGMAKLHGQGIPMNKFEAGKSFRAAAELGNFQAMTTLATMLHKGDGIPQDSTLAAEWMIKAATAQGDDLTDILDKLEQGTLSPEQRVQLSEKMDDLQQKMAEKKVLVPKDTSKPIDDWDDERGQV
jgi:TPR repeat protein